MRNGSITTFERSPCGTTWVCGSILCEEARHLQPLDDSLARLKAIDAMQLHRLVQSRSGRHAVEKRVVAAERELAFDVEHADLRQIVPLADIEVIEVVRRRDLDRAGALLGIGVIVANDRNAPSDQRQDRGLADQVLELFILRMHGDGDVAQHGFRPRGSDHDVIRPRPRPDT